MLKLYAAPMEGVTNHVWREAHRSVFGGADRYYAPFVTPVGSLHFQARELRELSRSEADLVPQVLTNRSDYFIWAARELQSMGFSEINFNLGCPSGTVVTKHKGSGLLQDPAELDALLHEIFTALPDAEISVKTRIGMTDAAEWPALLAVFERYPICALIVHPRVREQYYEGSAQREVFLQTLAQTKLPLVYNGDVSSSSDAAFSYGCGVMAGRGLIRNPALFRQARGGAAASREELTLLHELLLEGYRPLVSGDVPLLHRMKEFWFYFSGSFAEADRPLKQMKKARTLPEYRSAASAILQTCPLRAFE